MFKLQRDLCNSLKQASDLGLQGAVIWSTSKGMNPERCTALGAYVQGRLNQYVKALKGFATRCANKKCNGYVPLLGVTKVQIIPFQILIRISQFRITNFKFVSVLYIDSIFVLISKKVYSISPGLQIKCSLYLQCVLRIFLVARGLYPRSEVIYRRGQCVTIVQAEGLCKTNKDMADYGCLCDRNFDGQHCELHPSFPTDQSKSADRKKSTELTT